MKRAGKHVEVYEYPQPAAEIKDTRSSVFITALSVYLVSYALPIWEAVLNYAG